MLADTEDLVDNSTPLWSIEDDSLFYAKGLLNHTASRGKSVFVTWNENYIVNFVFKTSTKTKQTTLTKVRIPMPDQLDEYEEISSMLILEMNSLLLMRNSGCVYYFSSVKSMHSIEWLSAVRCIASCPRSQFSLIRLKNLSNEKQLCLEVFRDVPNLGKCSDSNTVLQHSYDISFDSLNIFGCDWLHETYSLLSVITNEENIEFLQKIATIGKTFRPKEDNVVLELSHEVHIFTISGNLFLLIGSKCLVEEDEENLHSMESKVVENHTIQLINSYAAPIKCIRVNFQKNILIVLLESGHMDVWYKSRKLFGSLQHLKHEIVPFLDYDFREGFNTFYFVNQGEITQLKIVLSADVAEGDQEDHMENECSIQETSKAVPGMVACTWVESLEQLVCLSFNNIFYRFCFETESDIDIDDDDAAANMPQCTYENLNSLFCLNSKRIQELSSRAKTWQDLVEQPNRLHQLIENEYQKQQVLAICNKTDLLNIIFRASVEYHMFVPATVHSIEDCNIMELEFSNYPTDVQMTKLYCLIYLELKKKTNFLATAAVPLWQLEITYQGQSLILNIPGGLLLKRNCFIVQYSITDPSKLLPTFCLNFRTFVRHQTSFLSVAFNVPLSCDKSSFSNILSHSGKKLQLFKRINFEDLIVASEQLNKIESSVDLSANNDCSCILSYRIEIIDQQHLLTILKTLHINNNLDISQKSSSSWEFYYLWETPIKLEYKEKNLTLTSNCPVALFYMKLLIISNLIEMTAANETSSSSSSSYCQKIMNYQCDVENLYGFLTTTETMDESDTAAATFSIQLEKLQKIYEKVRTEFNILLS